MLIVAAAIAHGACSTTVVSPSEPTTRLISIQHRPSRDSPLASGPLAFGNVPVLTFVEKQFEVANNGNSPLTITRFEGFDPEVFSLSWQGGTIEPGYFRIVVFRFRPVATTDYSGEVVAVADHTAGNNRLAFTGRGVRP
jgi:hypothetical protein